MNTITLPDCWGVDTNAKLTPASAKALASATVAGHPIKFVWRYVFFGAPPPGDLDVAETDAILESGLALMIVQHVRNPGWTATSDLGQSDARRAVANAKGAGVGAGSLALDLEGVKNSGQPVFDYCRNWGQLVAGEGFAPVLYVGYDAGLNADQLYALPTFARYWSDAGPRAVKTRGFCCKQFAQTKVAGVQVDPDHAAPDSLGGALVALTA